MRQFFIKLFEIILFLGFIMLIVFHIPMPEAKELVLQYHGVSYHADRDSGYNEKNTGLSLRYYGESDIFDFITVGTYKNSEFNQSTYAGVGWHFKTASRYISFNIMLGGVTGYSKKIFPIVVPSLQLFDVIHITGMVYPSPVVEFSIDLVKINF